MKLCKDCRHAIEPASGDEADWICSHPSSLFQRQSRVTGEMQSDQLKCSLVRNIGECGSAGKYWAARDIAPVGFV